ncbi:MAG: hypothetical protein LBQ02_04515 [Candidatus Nomurabacteria bacterium]|jgi:chromosome segregation ATPase|nr:hypothetical protein [Candidatus Nomurabacteria bacterium]
MSAKLNELRDEMNRKFVAKQTAHDEMQRVGAARSGLKNRLDRAWDEVQQARERMNSEHRRKQEAWGVYKRHHESLSQEIDRLSERADYAHARMKEEFGNASYCYEHGDKASAPSHAAAGRDWKDERNRLNQEKSNLINEAKWLSRPEDNFAHYKAEFDAAKGRHQDVQSQYQRAREAHDAARGRFNTAKSEFEAAKARFDSAKNEENAKWKTTSCMDCGAEIRYHVDWAHVPKRCKSCKGEREQIVTEKSTLYARFRSDHSPIDNLPAKTFYSRNSSGPYHLTMKYDDG